MQGLYIHIPFCVKKCSYCDFYSLPARLDVMESYVEAVVQEAKLYSGLSFQTLYLGGGTPSLLGAKNFKNLIDGISNSLDLSELVEATIEVNPESTTREFLEAMKGTGVNRVSFGIQTLADSELKSVGRIHTVAQAIEAITLAKKLGFKTISADLIIGLPGQTWNTFRATLETLVELVIEHLSVYCLSLEEGTPLAECPPRDLPSEDMQAELFGKAHAMLTRCGFTHYEISNFAIKGYECLHNLNYWRGGEYLGLGVAAASHLAGRRYRNQHDLDAYIENPTCLTEYAETLEPEQKAAEETMLRLRLLQEGVAPTELVAKFGHNSVKSLIGRLARMASHGKLVFEDSRYCLPTSRIITSNPIFAEVLRSGN